MNMENGRLNWFIFISLLALFVGTFLYRRTTPPPTPSSQRMDIVKGLKPSPPGAAGIAREAPPSAPQGPALGTSAQPSVRELAPTANSLRDEIVREPHRTPQSLIRFAQALAPRMEAARKSPEAASALLSQFRDCVAAGDLTPTVQALCLQDATRLSQDFPALRDQYQAVLESTPEDAKALAARVATLAGDAK